WSGRRASAGSAAPSTTNSCSLGARDPHDRDLDGLAAHRRPVRRRDRVADRRAGPLCPRRGAAPDHRESPPAGRQARPAAAGAAAVALVPKGSPPVPTWPVDPRRVVDVPCRRPLMATMRPVTFVGAKRVAYLPDWIPLSIRIVDHPRVR